MKKRWVSILIAFCAMATLFAGCDKKKGDGDPPTEPKSVYEQLQEASGKTTITLLEDLTIAVEDETNVTFGATGAEEIVVDGRSKGTKMRFTGMGIYALSAVEGATLVLKNMTIEDYTGNDWALSGGWRQGYFELAGKVRFENCNIKANVFLCAGSETEFIGCEFNSASTNMYSVWVAGKTAKFDRCTFTGCRGMKIHEQPEYDLLVDRIDLIDCTFSNLWVKPGLAIGNIELDEKPTEIYVDGCSFLGCQPWDIVGSYEGIDGFYEADTDSGEFTFVWTDTTVDGENAEDLEIERR